MKGFIAFMLCMVFLMFASVERGYTAQSKAEVGFNQGVPAMDISINMATPLTLTIDYGLMIRQNVNVLVSHNDVLQANRQANEIYTKTYNEARNVNQSQILHIDPGSQSCTIELSNHTQLVTILHIDPGNYSKA